MTLRTGLDRIAAGDVPLPRHRVGLLAHPASVDASLRPALTVLEEAGVEVVRLFGPEHGFAGQAQDMIGVDGARQGGRDVVSLYGRDEASLSPKPDDLEGLWAIVVDLQDVGSRYYTYVWTAALMLQAAAKAGVRTIALDRPNPLGGVGLEGTPQREGHLSFVGLYPVPVRHGMTLGEILRMVREVGGLDEEALTVVPMDGWDRAACFDATGLPWVLPSPNMPTLDTAVVYPGGCLIEGTALSEGRGTTRPFEVFGAPGLDGAALASSLEIPGAALRPLTFHPMFQKHAGADCGGVQLHVTDRARFRAFDAYRRLIVAMARQLGPRFAWRPDPYEFVSDIDAIDLLTGSPDFRELVDGGGGVDDLAELEASDREAEARFREERRRWLLYPEP